MTATTASSPGDDIIPVKWRTPDNDESEDDALDVHLDVIRAKDRAESTVNSHKRRLRLFIDWLVCHPARDEPKEGPGIELTTELTKRHLQDYFRKRANEGISKKTVETQMYTIKKFLKNLEDYDALSEGLHEVVPIPDTDKKDDRRQNFLDVERGEAALEYLRKYEWGSERHVAFELMWWRGLRLGAVHSIDVDDIEWDEHRVKLRHRPSEGTTLKNKSEGERKANMPKTTMDALEDWLDHPDRADDPEDEHGREPLFPTDDGEGRRSKQFLRDLMYSATRPCHYGMECPHDKDPKTCEAAQSKNMSYDCDSSKAPHAIRSGAITRMLQNEVPSGVISGEVDASERVIDKHYDEMTEDEQADQRDDYLDGE